jgi:hypothetical protein
MSWDMTWELPGPELDRQAVEAAVQKAVSEFPGVVLGSGVDEDLEEFAEDFAADEDAEDGLEFMIGLPAAFVRARAEGQPIGEPDEDGRYWGEIRFTPGFEGGPAGLLVHSGASQNRECELALSEVVDRIADLLGAIAVPS